MAELKMVAPLLSNMEVVSKLSEHAGTAVYIVKSTKSQAQYILKHISVPESQKQIDALIYSGAASSKEDAQKYYEQIAADYKSELELLEMLSSSQNIACCRSYQIEPKEEEIGYDLYLLSEYRKTLKDVMNDGSLTYLAAVNLGLDLCSALIDLRASDLMHRDVKPSNIYLNEQEHFMLGDLGLAKISDLKYCSIPEHMISSYSAPELFDLIGSIGLTTDIYSVGLILYRIFNGNHGPFEDEKTSAKAADKLRVTGKELPAPMFADYEMTNIILKACAFKPEDRYQTPDELRQELVDYVKRNQIEDTLITPPIVADEEPIIDTEAEEEIEPIQFADTEEMPEEFKQSFSPDTAMLNSIIDSVHKELEEEEKKQDSDDSETNQNGAEPVKRSRKRKKRLIPILIGILAALAAAAALYIFVIEPATIIVEDIALVSKDATSITVHVKSFESSGTFDVVCSDSYGNSFSDEYVKGEDNRFEGLAPGTAYTVTVKSDRIKTVIGAKSLHETTLAETTVLSFTATPAALTQVELNFTINGPDSENWSVSYGYKGQEPLETAFSGHSVVIGNLEPDKLYTFTLQNPDGIQLTGENSVQYSTVPTVEIAEKPTISLSTSKAIISWTFTGEEPEYWLIRFEGADGSSGEQKVTHPNISLDHLTSGLEYKVTISAPTMLRDEVLTIIPTATSVSDLKAEEQEDGNYLISWTCKDTDRENEWTLHVRPKGAAAESGLSINLVNDTSYVVDAKDLVPNTTYEVSLELASGEILEGDTASEFTTPTSKTFADYGATNSYLVLYLEPKQENWTRNNLQSPKTSFAPDDVIAFALQVTSKFDASVTDSVKICIVIRNENGLVLDTFGYEKPWNEMWDGDVFVGAFPRTPQDSGKYSYEILFNSEFVNSIDFTIQ